VLEEFDKVEDKKVLNSLLSPWETGRAVLNGQRLNISRTIWIATANAGQDVIADVHCQLPDDHVVTRSEYAEIMTRVRRSLSKELGYGPLLSRFTAILPFLRFTGIEKRTLTWQLMSTIGCKTRHGRIGRESFAMRALEDYIAEEGAHSLARAVQLQYDALD